MTVIVMSKNNNKYYLTSDGRTSQGWMGIASDNTVKVHSGKGCIYGVCGNASAKLIMKMLLNKTSDPVKFLKLLHHKDYAHLLQHSTTLVASQKFGCFTVHIHPRSMSPFGSSSGHTCEIIPWDDKNLPQIAGSGSLQVKALLSQYAQEPLPEGVKAAILQAYVTNHTIGGEISQISLDSATDKKPRKMTVRVANNKVKKIMKKPRR